MLGSSVYFGKSVKSNSKGNRHGILGCLGLRILILTRDVIDNIAKNSHSFIEKRTRKANLKEDLYYDAGL